MAYATFIYASFIIVKSDTVASVPPADGVTVKAVAIGFTMLKTVFAAVVVIIVLPSIIP